jgi:hypothetical protein
MGQQELLLIVLGIIIVGVAVIVGSEYFHSNAVQFHRDSVIKDLNSLAGDAQAFFKKPALLGGGQRSFQDYTLPQQLTSNENGTYELLTSTTEYVIIEGVGVETVDQNLGCSSGGNKVTYRINVTSNNTNLTQIH